LGLVAAHAEQGRDQHEQAIPRNQAQGALSGRQAASRQNRRLGAFPILASPTTPLISVQPCWWRADSTKFTYFLPKLL